MEFSFEGRVLLTLDYEPGMPSSKHVATNFNLDVSGNVDRDMYLDGEDLPTPEGSRALSHVLIQGLVGNIHFAHEKEFRDSAEHLRWIISELEKGFVAVANVNKDTFPDL